MSSSSRIINPRFGVVWGILTVLLVIAPLIVVASVSVSGAEFISFPWNEGFSFRWYKAIPTEGQFVTAAAHSIELAAATSAIAVLIGTFAAIAIVRYSFPGKGLVTLMGASPLFVPQVLTGLAISLALAASGVGSGLILLLVGHIVITMPFVLRVVSAALVGFDTNLEWAAMNLGASKTRTFFSVTLPQIRGGILASAIMAAIVSIDNVALSIFLAGPGFAILPVYLYHYAENQFNGIAAAVSVCMIAASLVGIAFLQKLVGLDKLFGGDADV